MQIRDTDFEFIRQLVYDQSSIRLGQEKREMVCSRLNNRLKDLGLKSIDDYCEYLRANSDAGEVTHLIDALSTNFTTFFREIEHFKFVKDRVIPEFLFSKLSCPLRAWSAACSTGEEAYSLAIILAASLQTITPQAWQITASDISTRVLEKASRGIYEADRVKLPNPAWLPRYFQKGTGEWEGYYRVKKMLREQIEFQHMNLLQPAQSQERFHLIFCRNVMIYFDQPTADTLVKRLCNQLHDGGYLIVGHAESLTRKPGGLQQITPSIFRRKARHESLIPA